MWVTQMRADTTVFSTPCTLHTLAEELHPICLTHFTLPVIWHLYGCQLLVWLVNEYIKPKWKELEGMGENVARGHRVATGDSQGKLPIVFSLLEINTPDPTHTTIYTNYVNLENAHIVAMMHCHIYLLCILCPNFFLKHFFFKNAVHIDLLQKCEPFFPSFAVDQFTHLSGLETLGGHARGRQEPLKKAWWDTGAREPFISLFSKTFSEKVCLFYDPHWNIHRKKQSEKNRVKHNNTVFSAAGWWGQDLLLIFRRWTYFCHILENEGGEHFSKGNNIPNFSPKIVFMGGGKTHGPIHPLHIFRQKYAAEPDKSFFCSHRAEKIHFRPISLFYSTRYLCPQERRQSIPRKNPTHSDLAVKLKFPCAQLLCLWHALSCAGK